MLPHTLLKQNKGFTPTPKHFGVSSPPHLFKNRCGGSQSERACLADRQGFTLIETLIAIIILVSAIVGTLSLASQGLSAAFVARDQITAFYLASEAVEYVRSKRDSNILNSDLWLSGLDNCISSVCTIEAKEYVNVACFGAHDMCPTLLYNTINFVYNHGSSPSNEATVFKRSVTINETVPDVEAEIIVIVSWRTKSLNRSFTIRETIFNWQRNFSI